MAKQIKSYGEAITEIETILSKIENQKFDVDELAANVKRVSELINLCKEKLHKTEDEIQKILDGMKE